MKETTITEVDDTERRVGEGEQNQEKEKRSGDNAEKLVQASDRFLENCKTSEAVEQIAAVEDAEKSLATVL